MQRVRSFVAGVTAVVTDKASTLMNATREKVNAFVASAPLTIGQIKGKLEEGLRRDRAFDLYEDSEKSVVPIMVKMDRKIYLFPGGRAQFKREWREEAEIEVLYGEARCEEDQSLQSARFNEKELSLESVQQLIKDVQGTISWDEIQAIWAIRESIPEIIRGGQRIIPTKILFEDDEIYDVTAQEALTSRIGTRFLLMEFALWRPKDNEKRITRDNIVFIDVSGVALLERDGGSALSGSIFQSCDAEEMADVSLSASNDSLAELEGLKENSPQPVTYTRETTPVPLVPVRKREMPATGISFLSERPREDALFRLSPGVSNRVQVKIGLKREAVIPEQIAPPLPKKRDTWSVWYKMIWGGDRFWHTLLWVVAAALFFIPMGVVWAIAKARDWWIGRKVSKER